MSEELHALRKIERQLEEIDRRLGRIERELRPRNTPITIVFKEQTMNPEGPGVTQAWTGTLSPAGSQFSTGTSFTAFPSDPTVTATVDATGLVVTIVYPSTFIANPASPFNVVYTASGIVPAPSSSPTSITATITPSAPIPTPTGISFAQTA
jgi:hypothetical protein